MGFLLFPIYGLLMGLRLAALRAAGAPLLKCSQWFFKESVKSTIFNSYTVAYYLHFIGDAICD